MQDSNVWNLAKLGRSVLRLYKIAMRLKLFYRLMVRPLFAEPVRTSLTVLAIALGVAVVLAIDLAGFAAQGPCGKEAFGLT